jgi:hypothetical protein
LAWPLPIEHLGVVYHIPSRGYEKIEEAVKRFGYFYKQNLGERKGILIK